MRNIVLMVVMNLVFIYLGEECLVISYSVTDLTFWSWRAIFGVDNEFFNIFKGFIKRKKNRNYCNNLIQYSRWMMISSLLVWYLTTEPMMNNLARNLSNIPNSFFTWQDFSYRQYYLCQSVTFSIWEMVFFINHYW